MNYVGIDLSKEYFDATVLTSSGEESHEQFENKATGFRAFQRWLKQHQVSEAHICMEATNIYWEELAEFLYAQGYTVSVVNPARIKGFAMSQLQRNKTDKLDSKVIAGFCQALKPRAWRPPSASQRKLRSLVRHREALVKTRTQQKNRLASCRDEDVRTSLESLIAILDAEIERNEKLKQELMGMIQGKEKKLANESFVQRAPADVVQRERDSLAELKEQLKSVLAALDELRKRS